MGGKAISLAENTLYAFLRLLEGLFSLFSIGNKKALLFFKASFQQVSYRGHFFFVLFQAFQKGTYPPLLKSTSHFPIGFLEKAFFGRKMGGTSKEGRVCHISLSGKP